MFWFKKKNIIPQVTSVQSVVDYTLLNPTATDRDVEDTVNKAIKNGYFAVCVNGCNVKYAADYKNGKVEGDLRVVAVVGFPLGASSKQIKVAEAKQAISDGADELDVVINIGKAKDGDYDYVKDELLRIVRISHGKTVKAIIETCYFGKEEIIKLSKICAKAKVDYIKTSTGFGTGGATPEVVACICEACEGRCQVKAAGGIRTAKQAEELIRAGATRIGTSTEI